MGMDAVYKVFLGYKIEDFPTLFKDFKENYDEMYDILTSCGDFLIFQYGSGDDFLENSFIGLELFDFDWDYGIQEYQVVKKPEKSSLYFLIQNAPEKYKSEVRKIIEDNEPKLYHYCDYW